MKSFLRNVALLSFTGGVAAAVAGAKLPKSDKARQLAVKTLATGMKAKDDAMAALETIREDAKDLCYEAKKQKDGE